MTRSVRISMKAARAILDHLDRYGHHEATPAGRGREELRQAMAPPRVRPVRRVPRVLKSAARRQETADIRRECLRRAGGVCECGCGQSLALEESAPWEAGFPELDHMFGRGNGRLPQSSETCWLLRADCHRQKTRNEPDAATWWKKFLVHATRQVAATSGVEQAQWAKVANAASARLRFVEVRASLPAAPRL